MSDYTFCGRPVRIWNNSVYDEYDHWMGHLFEDTEGGKHVFGPNFKGPLIKNAL